MKYKIICIGKNQRRIDENIESNEELKSYLEKWASENPAINDGYLIIEDSKDKKWTNFSDCRDAWKYLERKGIKTVKNKNNIFF